MVGRVKSLRYEVGHLRQAIEPILLLREFHFSNYSPEFSIPAAIEIIGEVFGGLAPP